MPIGARPPPALWDFQNIQQHLCCHSFNSVVIDFAANTFQRQPPRIGRPCGRFGLRTSMAVFPECGGVNAPTTNAPGNVETDQSGAELDRIDIEKGLEG